MSLCGRGDFSLLWGDDGKVSHVRRQSQELMVLAPSATLAFGVAVIASFIIGLLGGIIIKNSIRIGVVVAVLLVMLNFLGIATPDEVLGPILALARSGSALTCKVKEGAGYLPCSSVRFLTD
jgi:hypothetical protein